MNARRLLTAVSAGLVGATAIVVGIPSVATAAPAAPKNLSVARTAADEHKIQMSWKPGGVADHYVVDIIAGDVQTVVDVPATTTSYQIDAPEACTSYKIRVGASDADGSTAYTGTWSLKSLTPGMVMGLAPTREEEGTVAVATWRAPAWLGYTPVTGYRTVFTRLSDGVVLSDKVSMDTSFRYEGIDPARAYTLQVFTVNEYGSCAPAKSLLDRFRPAEPTNLVVQRRADAPGTVEAVWVAPKSGPAPSYYLVSYGQSKITKSVQVAVPLTSHTLALDTATSWIVEVKAYNLNGGSSAVAGSVPVWGSALVEPAATVTPPVAPPATPEPSPSTEAPAATPSASSSTAPSSDTGTDTTTTTTTVATGPDRTPPTIAATLSHKATNAWFRTPPTIHFTCADNSGTVATCPADIRVTTDGAAQRFSATAVDPAGNTVTTTLTLNVDQTAPTITASVIGAKNADGWYSKAPVIRYTCSDAVSTISTCPADTPVNVQGLHQTITGTALDKAGNTATAPVVLNLDLVAPVITATVVGDANADGWYTTPPTVRFTCTDTGSGIASCPADRTVDTDGTDREVTGTAVDAAGNTSSTTVVLDIDRTAPAITAEVLGDLSADGWYRTTPTVHFTCTDAESGSGIAACPADVPVYGDGSGQQVVGTAKDRAGNTATAAVTVNVDRFAPELTATIDGTATADGWYRTAPVVRFVCRDEDSGVAVCPEDTPVTTDGAGQEITGTMVDKAGNTTTATVTVSVDRSAPAITATVIGDASAGGWYRTPPTVRFTCTDTGSGIAECPADGVATEERVTGIAYDKAGNSASTSVTIGVDRIAPTVTVAGVANGGTYGAEAEPVVACRTVDRESGVATEAVVAHTVKSGKHTVLCSGAVDRAGNAAAPVKVTYTVEPTVAWLIALTHKYADGPTPQPFKDLDVALNKGQFGHYIVKIALHSLNRKSGLTTAETTELVYWALVLQMRD
ncbi:fibronectin type III domain-containing protein [Jidongwangia harbinensis]|uniref:fibronectin type III domain-containing protein n=1 Tax=Jidongwangia harbinensis TaxID=2878561 RepID=UPI001CD9E397|nr:fibronectin type III domain-containing protein [Jidongwangia harbinensis]MCA2213948.1 fibronectin type III domain-containing protein [Jidongwangia harbinensis]